MKQHAGHGIIGGHHATKTWIKICGSDVVIKTIPINPILGGEGQICPPYRFF